MVKFTFENLTKTSLGFRVYERYSWTAGSKLVLSIVDSTSVSTKIQLTQMKKQFTTDTALIDHVNNLSTMLKDLFPEGSTSFSIEIIQPVPKPSIVVDLVSPYREVGEKQLFTVETKNLDGKVLVYMSDQKVAKLLSDNRTIVAVGPGRTILKVGTKSFYKEYEIHVEEPETDPKEE